MSDYKDVKGRWLTQSLFPETSQGVKKFLKYRLEDSISKQYAHLPVLRHLYMDMMDTTEYLFAQKYLGGWEHWQRCLGNAAILAHVEVWREELEVKMVALGLKQIVDTASDPNNKGNLQAARVLADKGFKPKREAGRPSKKEKEAQLKFDERLNDAVASDLDRIRNIQ